MTLLPVRETNHDARVGITSRGHERVPIYPCRSSLTFARSRPNKSYTHDMPLRPPYKRQLKEYIRSTTSRPSYLRPALQACNRLYRFITKHITHDRGLRARLGSLIMLGVNTRRKAAHHQSSSLKWAYLPPTRPTNTELGLNISRPRMIPPQLQSS